jgi:hypothetical protein
MSGTLFSPVAEVLQQQQQDALEGVESVRGWGVK